jgi:Pvc16 N-terminal domain
MSASTAIGMVSESLQNLLLGETSLTPPPDVTILAPDESGGGNKRINLFLYKVVENPMFKNLDWQLKPNTSNTLMPPPLSLNLFYLMTAYNQNDAQSGNSPTHEILGDCMRVFYDNPIIPPDYLADGLEDAKEEIKIILNTLDLEELSKVWATFTKAFRLSVLYEVSVVQLEKLPGKERTIAERVRTIGVPRVHAPYSPPLIESLNKISATAGSIIEIIGKHFSGWKADVYLSGRKIADKIDLYANTFEVTLPNDLDPGFYEFKVDISRLTRQTFIFEVIE